MMNKKQLSYQIGRVLNPNYDLVFASLTGLFLGNLITHFAKGEVSQGIMDGGLCSFVGYSVFLAGRPRILLSRRVKEIQSDASNHPLEHAEKIIIEDQGGLEFLLSKTQEGGWKEWGTMVKSYHDQEKAIIDDILDITRGRKLGYMKKETSSSVKFNFEKAYDEGFQGTHHYHRNIGPKWFGAHNFALSFLDRFSPIDSINLLTFNMPDGPEIIGYNNLHIYIPAVKSKRELVKANPKQIMGYLSRN